MVNDAGITSAKCFAEPEECLDGVFNHIDFLCELCAFAVNFQD